MGGMEGFHTDQSPGDILLTLGESVALVVPVGNLVGSVQGLRIFLVLAAGLSATNGRDGTSTDGGADVEDVGVVSCSLRTVSDAPGIISVERRNIKSSL